MFAGHKMVKHWREFLLADEEAWSQFAAAAELGEFQMIPLKRKPYRALRVLDALTWTARSTAINYRAWQGMHPLWLVHHGVHYLCDAHASKAPPSRRRPLSMLYFENLACNIDAYYAARIVQRLGVKDVQANLLETYPFTLFEESSRRLGRTRALYMSRLAKTEPFELFKTLIREVDRLQGLVGQALPHFGPSGANTHLDRVVKDVAARPDLTFSCYFDHLLHTTFARFHQGTRVTKDDLATKARCAAVLDRAASFSDFLGHLGGKRLREVRAAA